MRQRANRLVIGRRTLKRSVCAAIVIVLAIPAIALADPSTTQGYTGKDQARFAKIGALSGTWTCTDTPASKAPDVLTAKQTGNWYVWTETGDTPGTTHVRWDHRLQQYVRIEIEISGWSEIYQTKSLDPLNATWIPQYPPNSGLYAVAVSFDGHSYTSVGKFTDPATGRVFATKQVCTRR